MSRNFRLMCALLAMFVMGGLIATARAAADDPPANPPARQRGPGGPGGMRGGIGGLMLLRSDVVQKDLELTDDQKDSITKLQDKAREAFSSLQGLSQEERQAKMLELRKDQDEKIGGILNAKQKSRLKEIGLQQMGALALASKEIAEALKLTDDQVNKIKDLADSFQKDAREAFQSAANGGDPTSARDAVTKLRKESSEKIMAVLSDDQKASFEKMKGAKIDLPPGGFFGGGRNRGGN
jgi:Spy/CpxP family protein refolding chaperone